ncbi:MAG: arsenical efflux pump membrane protein ArsB, partial [Clostridia bacterium]|nr:arsenical efflux pump membrane protein ArsB [Clostridia bacterium]
IGSNIGAFLTPIGALAGIMWNNILRNHNVKYSYLDFIKTGFIVSIPTLLVALLTLIIMI